MKIKNVLRKDFYMELKKSWPRFLSILAMVFLGVAFFSGIRACGPDMKRSADAFFDRTQLMDIRVFGDLGLTKEDVEKISSLDGVELAEGSYTADVLWELPQNQFPVKFMSISSQMDQITVKQGRMPEKAGECLIDEKLLDSAGCKVGDIMELSSGTEEKLSQLLNHSKYEIVGVGTSPYYLSLERGTTEIGNGELKGFVAVLPDEFAMEVYPQVIVKRENVKGLLCYSQEYEEKIDETIQSIEGIAGERCRIRYTNVKSEAEEEIADGEEELKDAKQKLADGKKKIKDAKEEVEEGEQEIEKNEKLLADKEKQLASSKKTLADGKKQLKEAKAQLKKAGKKLKKAKKKLDAAEKEYKQGKKEYDEGMSQLKAAKKQVSSGESQIASGKKKLSEGEQQLAEKEPAISALRLQIADGEGILDEADLEQMRAKVEAYDQQKAALDASKKQLAQIESQVSKAKKTIAARKPELKKAKTALAKAEKKLKKGKKEYQQGKKELEKNRSLVNKKEKELKKGEQQLKEGEQQLAKGKSQLAEAKKELSQGKKDYEDALKKWKKEKTDADRKIKKGEKELSQAKEDLAELEMPEWYVYSRNSIQTYVEYEQDSERIEAIGKVFPVVFFLVAALVCLTTMTRMVQEDRTQIGVLKALGYRESQISMKYIAYALSSSLIGSLLGIVGGQKLLPVVVMNAYGIMYNNLPDMVSPLHLNYSLMSSLAALLCVVAAAYGACHATLREVPADLMRPVAPKAGKRVFLERLSILWKRIHFSGKAAIRNLVRYKKRLLMTVFGIGACMGILLVGFGIKDSITAVGEMQFGRVRHYDMDIRLEEDATRKEKEELYQSVDSDSRIKKWMNVMETSVDVGFGGKEKSAYLEVPEEPSRFSDFVGLSERTSGKKHTLGEDGVILTEKLASLLGLKAGDQISLKEGDDQKGVKVKVDAIVENYFYHYVYISPALYEKLYGEKPEYQNLYTVNTENGDEFEEQMREDYLEMSAVAGTTFVSGTAQRVRDMLKSMDAIIVVIVVAAGLLAFVVLYNLNNINISERKRELATLKVLGFYDGEVSRYIFRENIILTLLGMILGVFIGIFLHRFVILTAEIDMMMFGRTIAPASYAYSVALTVLFSTLVNVFMHFKMKRIDMIESLKSVE